MSDIELQFDKLRDFIDDKDNYDELTIDLMKFNIDYSLKPWLLNQVLSYITIPMMYEQFHCFNDNQNKSDLIKFLFGFNKDNYENFLNNENIDVQDKFYALVTRYIIISTLPEEFKSTKDMEMGLFYDNMESVIKNYAEYIKSTDEEQIKANFIFTNSLTKIISDVFSGCNRTDYDRDVSFITNLFRLVPSLNKDRIINFQGQPLFNKSIQMFLNNFHKNDNVIASFQESIKNDPSLIYKFSTTRDHTNHAYESIDSSKNFSGNFICNFKNVVNSNGDIVYEERRCRPNLLSEILFAINYNKIPEENKVDLVNLLCCTLNSLCGHVKSLKDANNLEELQKINYLLNCPIKDPTTNEFFTPMDLIYKVAESEKEILAQQQEDLLKYTEQLRTEPVYLQTMEEVKNSIEFKKAVEHKIDEEETKRGNEEIKKLQDKVREAEEKAKHTLTYRFLNAISKFFLKRETKYKTKQQILAEKNLSKKMDELSEPFFASASQIAKKKMSDLELLRQQEMLTKYHNKGIDSTVDVRDISWIYFNS